jgi:hypothetical protein
MKYVLLAICLLPTLLGAQILQEKNKIFWAVYGVETRYGQDTIPHLKSDSVSIGLMQITPILINDLNAIYGTHFILSDRHIYSKCVTMFFLYQNHYNPTWDFEKAARIWNGGPGGMNKKSTIVYWNKVKAVMKSSKFKRLINK